jgi:hypothetical protein
VFARRRGLPFACVLRALRRSVTDPLASRSELHIVPTPDAWWTRTDTRIASIPTTVAGGLMIDPALLKMADVLRWGAELRGLVADTDSVPAAASEVAIHLNAGLGCPAVGVYGFPTRLHGDDGTLVLEAIAAAGEPLKTEDLADRLPAWLEEAAADEHPRPYRVFRAPAHLGLEVTVSEGDSLLVVIGTAPVSAEALADLFETVALNVALALRQLPASVVAA